MLQGYLQSNCVYVVLWEGVVTNVQIDIFNCLCSGYRDTTDRKSLLGRSGLVRYFMIWDGGWLGNDSQAFQSFNFVVEGDYIFMLNRLVFKICYFVHVNSSVNFADS